MRTLISLAIIIATCSVLKAQPISNPEASLSFIVLKEGGVNGIAVAYNPKQNIYYTAIAGNADFPLDGFSGEENVYEGKVGFDARGLWYNTKSNTLEGNGYGGESIYVIPLDEKGLPSGGAENKFRGAQPDDQAVGIYDASTDEILYFDVNTREIIRYKRTSGKEGKGIQLKNCPVDYANLNSALIYTGQKNYEIGLYDYVDAKLYFFNKKGEYQVTVLLPEDSPYNETFNFSYANGHVFLFDKDMREWIGYKIF